MEEDSRGDATLYFNDQKVDLYVVTLDGLEYETNFSEAGGSTTIHTGEAPESGTEVKVCIDSEDLISNDGNEENDCKTVTFRTDLAVTELLLDETGAVEFTVSNVGNQDISSLEGDASGDVQIYFDGEVVDEAVLGLESATYGTDFYQAGHSTTFKTNEIPESGTEVKVCLNSEALITGDADPENDCNVVTFSMDLAIVDIVLDEEDGAVTFMVSNVGNQSIQELEGDGTAEVELYFNGNLTEVYTLDTTETTEDGVAFLEAGGVTTVQTEKIPSSRTVVEVCLDPGALIEGDANSENDCKRVTFEVDLAITLIESDATGELSFTLSNLGNQAVQSLESDSSGEVKLYFDNALVEVYALAEESMTYGDDFTLAGGSTVISTGHKATGGTTVKVCVQPEALIEGLDGDDSNDCLSIQK
jgi:hypothetical protein